ncbi:heme NO-binding domain-containing protein [Sulfitobacter mediterraneus]|uniref:heme NO-binding domain-containing protein n=1 Tax=Sulfitobacter mediterraneus TaxID=83219 RepID=UPI0019396739|nr:heme NO-binding domain-containing protein [Sulfitobacter mediterraneus]MBM1556494.1 heme NO-binding domain-containing protein [Sulfitobacter mediterraneus]MBM1567467.1 heme NO-binding domain-containing protein [Sulfitobacter mediterraneus]MBM1571848.1 heme NO-binding domain-containing protein [Sulfitobacter mediterraneus]MBM1575637.1 heme NO-binding domain-containing protein [Sulfitobacter mediterraneus]MBM1578873.1 heme NO-binding domain-containing protein [Sulfitobacter mediterraneus]
MHGLFNRSIQNFVCDTYGPAVWEASVRHANLDFIEFEAMLEYDDAITPAILDAVSKTVERPRVDVMEDIGTYLVSHPRFEGTRRLLRFGGVNFEDFLHSLDDLADRARLALSDLHLPRIELRDHVDGHFSLICEAPVAGYGHVMMGVLRVMADDYGALALLEHTGGGQGVETVSITLVKTDFSEGRRFDLGARAS